MIPVAGLLMAVALHQLSRRSRYGKALLAVVQNPDAARLMGINVTAAIVITFALSGLFAGVAGILIATAVHDLVDHGHAVRHQGIRRGHPRGITNAWGVVVAGLLYGLAEALITALLGSTHTQIVTFTLVIIAWR